MAIVPKPPKIEGPHLTPGGGSLPGEIHPIPQPKLGDDPWDPDSGGPPRTKTDEPEPLRTADSGGDVKSPPSATAADAHVTPSFSSNPYAGPPTTATVAASTQSNAAAASSQVIPVWAIPLIVIAAVMCLTFVASLAIFCSRERQRKYERRGAKEPSYGRAVGRALSAATGLFIPLWIAKRCSGSREKEKERLREERSRAYFDQATAYDKLQQQYPEFKREERDRAKAYPAPAAQDTALSPAPLERRGSTVSSLSSASVRSVGRYERLDVVPSPVSEEAPYPWETQDTSGGARFNNSDGRHAGTGPRGANSLEIPQVGPGRRPGNRGPG